MAVIVNPDALPKQKDALAAILAALKAYTFDRLSMMPMREEKDAGTGDRTHTDRSQNQRP